ncbi:hypothetical protein HZC53_00970 [Candidatus Uhrbacteria bacterium]|nr:hypothetical protein [Candidatus Uhrbacteria bacterium]
MQNKFEQSQQPPKEMTSKEGCSMTKEGVITGDKHFHEVSMGTTPEIEQQDLDAISTETVSLAECQIRGLAKSDLEAAIRGFKALILRYPDHPNTASWREEIERLK